MSLSVQYKCKIDHDTINFLLRTQLDKKTISYSGYGKQIIRYELYIN